MVSKIDNNFTHINVTILVYCHTESWKTVNHPCAIHSLSFCRHLPQRLITLTSLWLRGSISLKDGACELGKHDSCPPLTSKQTHHILGRKESNINPHSIKGWQMICGHVSISCGDTQHTLNNKNNNLTRDFKLL